MEMEKELELQYDAYQQYNQQHDNVQEALPHNRQKHGETSSSSWPSFIRLVWQHRTPKQPTAQQSQQTPSCFGLGGGFAASQLPARGGLLDSSILASSLTTTTTATTSSPQLWSQEIQNQIGNDDQSANKKNDAYEMCLDHIQKLQGRLFQLQQRLYWEQQQQQQQQQQLPSSLVLPPTQSQTIMTPSATLVPSAMPANSEIPPLQSRKIATRDIGPFPKLQQLKDVALESLTSTGHAKDMGRVTVSLWYRDPAYQNLYNQHQQATLILTQQDLVLAMEQAATTDCLEIMAVAHHHSNHHHNPNEDNTDTSEEYDYRRAILKQGPAYFKIHHSEQTFRLVSKERIWSTFMERASGTADRASGDSFGTDATASSRSLKRRKLLDLFLHLGLEAMEISDHSACLHQYQLVIRQGGNDRNAILVLLDDHDLFDAMSIAASAQQLELYVVSKNSSPSSSTTLNSLKAANDPPFLSAAGKSASSQGEPNLPRYLVLVQRHSRHQFDSKLIMDSSSPSYERLCHLIAGTFCVHVSRVVVMAANVNNGEEARAFHDDSGLLSVLRECAKNDKECAEMEVTFTKPRYVRLSWKTMGQDMATFGTDSISSVEGGSSSLSLHMLQELASMKYKLSPSLMLLFTSIEDSAMKIEKRSMISSNDHLLNQALLSPHDTVEVMVRPIILSLSLTLIDGEYRQIDIDIQEILDGDNRMPSLSKLREVACSSWNLPSLGGFFVHDETNGHSPIRSDHDLQAVVTSLANIDGDGKIAITVRGGRDRQAVYLSVENAFLSDSLTCGSPEEEDYAPPLEFRCAYDSAAWNLMAAGITIPGMYRAVLDVSSDGVGWLHAGAANIGSQEWKELRKVLPKVKFGSRSFDQYQRLVTNPFPVQDVHQDKFVVSDAGSCFNIQSVSLELVEPLAQALSR